MQERKDFELSNEITVVNMTLTQNVCVAQAKQVSLHLFVLVIAKTTSRFVVWTELLHHICLAT